MHLKLIAASLQAIRSTGYLPSLSTLEALLVVASLKERVCKNSDIVSACKTSPASASTYLKQLVRSRMCKRVVNDAGERGIILDEDGHSILSLINSAVKSIIDPALAASKAKKAPRAK